LKWHPNSAQGIWQPTWRDTTCTCWSAVDVLIGGSNIFWLLSIKRLLLCCL